MNICLKIKVKIQYTLKNCHLFAGAFSVFFWFSNVVLFPVLDSRHSVYCNAVIYLHDKRKRNGKITVYQENGKKGKYRIIFWSVNMTTDSTGKFFNKVNCNKISCINENYLH